MAPHEVEDHHAVVSETHIEPAPAPAAIFSEKGTAIDIKEISVTTSSTPSFHTRRYSRASRKTAPKKLPLDRFFKKCKRQSPFTKGLFLTIVSGIPFAVFLIVSIHAYPHDTFVEKEKPGATLTQVAKWLLISWGVFMGLLWSGRIFAEFATWACKQSEAWIKYQRLVAALCLRVVMMFWAIICFAVIPSVFHSSFRQDPKTGKIIQNWVVTLQLAFKFLIIAFAIIVVQGLVLEAASIQYIQGWMGPRSQRASDELETIKQLHDLVDPHTDDHVTIMGKVIRKLIMPVDDENLYYQISHGWGNPQSWTEYAREIWSTISQGKPSITRFDIDQQLRAMNRNPDLGHDLFTQLDDSCDGEVTFEEVDKLVNRVGEQLQMRDHAQHGITRLLAKLEILLSVVLFGVLVLIGCQFFSNKDQLANLKAFWAGVMGFSFAFAGPVLEFVNSCIFVFARHPYDVGDYIEAKGKKLIVQKIFLTHTNFEEVADPKKRGVVVQCSHASLLAEPLVNWTRTLEEVIDEKATTTKETADKDKVKSEAETKATENARELVQLKVEQLKGIKEEEKSEEKY